MRIVRDWQYWCAGLIILGLVCLFIAALVEVCKS